MGTPRSGALTPRGGALTPRSAGGAVTPRGGALTPRGGGNGPPTPGGGASSLRAGGKASFGNAAAAGYGAYGGGGGAGYGAEEVLESRIHFADLAGSENTKASGVAGVRFNEACNINQGLLALGNVRLILCILLRVLRLFPRGRTRLRVCCCCCC